MKQILTTNRLLFGQKLKLLNDVSEQVIDEIDTFKGDRYTEPLLDHFWKRLRTEYIPSLRNFRKNYRKSSNVAHVVRTAKIYLGKAKITIDRSIV